MPRLEELELFLVTFSPYDEDLPVPTFGLRKYVYCNYRTFDLDRTNARGTGVPNWSLPLAVSANTLRHVYILLHGSRELQEAHAIPSLDCVEYLGLRGNAVHGFPEDSSGRACLIARFPRLRLLALHGIRRSTI